MGVAVRNGASRRRILPAVVGGVLAITGAACLLGSTRVAYAAMLTKARTALTVD